MKNVALVVVIVLVGIGFWLLLRGQKRGASKAPAKDVYLGLRNLALHSSRAKLNLPAETVPTQPWGVVMDWGIANGTATVVAFSNGQASIYLSSGGGFLGGGESHDSVRDAAKRMVAAAGECQQHARPANHYPLPQPGEATFYFLTDAGVVMAAASAAELSDDRHPLSKLGKAGQDVIAQYRLIK